MPPVGEALHALAAGQVFAGDYRIVERLAEGGMGAVYVAEQLSTRRRRALKLMRPDLARDPRSRERFVREAQIGATIQSEHIVEVIAAGIDEPSGTPWLAMELLSGETLHAHVQRRGPLPPSVVLEIVRQLGHALDQAHRAGVVHRDLKPENVFLSNARRSDVELTVKVLDFGIAKWVHEHTDRGTQAIGTPFWMAPEQTQADAALTPQTDIWALGLLTFYLLTGKVYWRSAHERPVSIASFMREMLVEPMAPASVRSIELGAGPLPSGFDSWFARCLGRDPARRFVRMSAVMFALTNVLRPPNATPNPGLPPTERMSPDMVPGRRPAPPRQLPAHAPRAPQRASAVPRGQTKGGCGLVLWMVVLGAVGFAGCLGLAVIGARGPSPRPPTAVLPPPEPPAPPPVVPAPRATEEGPLVWRPLRSWTRLYYDGTQYPAFAREVQPSMTWNTRGGPVRLFVPRPRVASNAAGELLQLQTVHLELHADWAEASSSQRIAIYPAVVGTTAEVDQDRTVFVGERDDGRILVSLELLRQRGRQSLRGSSRRVIAEWDPRQRRVHTLTEWEGATRNVPPLFRVRPSEER
jgi:serine/threonine protein kinase